MQTITRSILQQKNSKHILMALLAAVLWGISGTVGQYLFQEKRVDVEWLISVRLLAAGGLLLVLSVAQGEQVLSIWKNKKDCILLLSFSVLGMVAVQYTYFAAIKYSNAATATVLQYIGPVLIVVYMAISKKRMPSVKEFVALILAMLGTFLLVTHGNPKELSLSPEAFLLGISSAIALAVYTLLPARLLVTHSPALVVGWGMLIGGIVFSPIRSPWDVSGIWDTNTYAALGYIILLGTLIPFYCYLKAVQMIGGEKASLLASAEPLSAMVIGVFWLQIVFTGLDYLGSLCIVSTIFILSYSSKS
ncbi:DMT family transporter [Sphingobacterium suaedae]|uniref:DMT family transporter n=1 Tax=Sphingobacterium suaedae TaxID=1686402 RepID=A0ABW5KFJ5_9SPHI